MHSPTRFSRPLALAVAAVCGCYAPAIRYTPEPSAESLDVVSNAPAKVYLERDSTVYYARVRLIGDTLYGWEAQLYRTPKDSEAIAVRRIQAIEQDRLSPVNTLGAVAAGVLGVISAGFIALIIIMHGDHS